MRNHGFIGACYFPMRQTFSSLLALCEEKPWVTKWFSSQGTSDTDVRCIFVASMNKPFDNGRIVDDLRLHDVTFTLPRCSTNRVALMFTIENRMGRGRLHLNHMWVMYDTIMQMLRYDKPCIQPILLFTDNVNSHIIWKCCCYFSDKGIRYSQVQRIVIW